MIGGSFVSVSDPRFHFGLGSAGRVELTLLWPDGHKTVLRGLAANRTVVFRRAG